ncbi:hypothetical protein HXZ27_18725 [Micromonospora carbonacea subsp. aurantiaca]|uniref:Uncharacterized protein n=1 Tax=Micromonospora carbonacea TaxID=47853 RepID=A0A7H8XLV9_9ACTN|nr:hypothetical protein HXZ27_18725 [Micromonospora carbonacea]
MTRAERTCTRPTRPSGCTAPSASTIRRVAPGAGRPTESSSVTSSLAPVASSTHSTSPSRLAVRTTCRQPGSVNDPKVIPVDVSDIPHAGVIAAAGTPVAATNARKVSGRHCSPPLTMRRTPPSSQRRPPGSRPTASATSPRPKFGDQPWVTPWRAMRSSQRVGSASTSPVATCTEDAPRNTPPRW